MTNLSTNVRLVVRYTTDKEGNPSTPHNRPYKNLNKQGIQRIEKIMGKRHNEWAHGFANPAGGSTLKLWYYHPSEIIGGVPRRLTKEEYNEVLKATRATSSYSLWIIPTNSQKVKNGHGRAISKTIENLEGIPKHYNRGILRIDVYQNRKLVGRYDHRGYQDLTAQKAVQ